MKLPQALPLVALVALTGCFTVYESDYPAVEMTPAANKDMAVTVSGFEATVTTYQAIYDYSTMYGYHPGFSRHGRYCHGYVYPYTMATTTYIPQVQVTAAYQLKVQDALESAGYIVNGANPTYTVSARFTGPQSTEGEQFAEFATMLLSVLTADRIDNLWSAHLKITENASGRVVFSRVFTQQYSACVWGPLPIFSPLSSDKVQVDFAKSWCLSALADRCAAEATAFLAAQNQVK